MNYLVWLGLRRYGTPRQQAEFARRSVNLFMRNWTTRGTCNENYRSTDGTGDDHPHYTWGALLCQIGIEALYDIKAAVSLGCAPPAVMKGRGNSMGNPVRKRIIGC